MASIEMARVLALMGHQHGVATRAQIRALGVTDSQMKRLTAAGVLQVVDVGVVRQRGAAETWEQRVWVALLRAGVEAVVSHRAARSGPGRPRSAGRSCRSPTVRSRPNRRG